MKNIYLREEEGKRRRLHHDVKKIMVIFPDITFIELQIGLKKVL